MKVFALTALLISICCIEGGLVKRQAEEEPQGEVSTTFTSQLSEFIRKLQQETEGFATSIKERFGQPTVEDVRRQFDTAIQQFQDSFDPIAEHIRQNVGRLFTLPGQAQQPVEEGS
ncbi:apolipoprotein A-II-like [Pseudonaja textilis]|uniref:apolipoprotein A-II-like n=1 Tax=Pseudonaja textilis TaxID=8673 RepID=UPI000EA9E791|nr:apolipoprotein A-II-like [Pseudonaja textilis]